VPPPVSHLLTAARAAFEERRWADAVDSFLAAEANGAANLTARDHDRLAAAAYLALLLLPWVTPLPGQVAEGSSRLGRGARER